MKKVLLIVAMATMLFSADSSDKNRAQLVHDMKSMTSAMEEIQRGGLYNCSDCMKDGVKKLKEGLKSISSVDAQYFLPEHQGYAYKFVQKRAKMINMYADDLVETINQGHMDEALEDYTQILRQCMSCHLRIRSW